MKLFTLAAMLVLGFVTSWGQAGDAVPFRVTPGFTILPNPTPEPLPVPKVKEPAKQPEAKPAAQLPKSVYQFANTAVPPCPAPGPGWVWDSIDGSFRLASQMLPTNLATGQFTTQAQTTCVNGQCVTTQSAVQTATTATVMPAPVMQAPVMQAQPRFMTYVPNIVGTVSNCVNGNCTVQQKRK